MLKPNGTVVGAEDILADKALSIFSLSLSEVRK
jgi:hypothetical protein